MYNKKIFKETFSALRTSEETLTEILKMTTKKKKNYRALRVIPIVALIMMMFSIVVLAAVNFTPGFTNVEFTPYENPAAMLQAFFGENGKTHSGGIVEYDEYGNQIFNIPGWERLPVDETLADELIVPYISAETISVSWDDYTLSVEANLYDNVTGAGILYYTIENPNGVIGFELWPNGHIWYPDTMSFGIVNSWASKSYIDETMSTNTKIYICDYYIKPEGWSNQLQLKVWSNEKEEDIAISNISLADGGSMRTLRLSDGDVLVSPIGICINEETFEFDSASYIHNIILRYTDGSEYVLVDSAGFVDNSMYALHQGGGGSGGEGPYRTTYLFNRIVDINSLTEIVMDDITVSIN